MPMFVVHVIIENKPNISDPEGDTILNDLVLKSKNSPVKKIRAGKILKFTVEANDEKNAEKTIEGTILDDLGLAKVCCRRHMLTHVDIE